MIRRTLLALALAAAPAAAQTTSPALPPASPPARVEFLSRFDFGVAMEHLFSDDDRFVWDAEFGGDMDLVDYGRGRLAFAAVYETILGREFRIFDPNQGNYTLAGELSARAGDVELSGVFHHVSRHLSDRPKRHPVDWNMIGGRVRGRLARGRTDLRGRVDLRRVIQKSFVDYRWELEADTHARVAFGPRVSAVVQGGARVVGVDGSRGRGAQYGARAEGGIRLDGRAAALELFAAVERRIDPYQLEFAHATWLTTGFRLVGR